MSLNTTFSISTQDPVILYVDDEIDSLEAFTMAFGGEFRLLTSASPAQALGLLHKSPESIAVVIADQRMPEITGIEFLQDVKATVPHALRYLVTAYSDISVLVDAINLNIVHRYIEKPWDTEMLNRILHDATLRYDAKKTSGIQEPHEAVSNLEVIRLAAAGVLFSGVDQLTVHTTIASLLVASSDFRSDRSIPAKLGKMLNVAVGSMDLTHEAANGRRRKSEMTPLMDVLPLAIKTAEESAERNVSFVPPDTQSLRGIMVNASPLELRQFLVLYFLSKSYEIPKYERYLTSFAVQSAGLRIELSGIRAAGTDFNPADNDRALEIAFGLRLLACWIGIEVADLGMPRTGLAVIPADLLTFSTS